MKTADMIGAVQLDPSCIVKQGYLTKSPPTGEVTLIRKRWHLRWFVLYDTHAGDNVDKNTARDVFMLYYKNDIKVNNGTPKGKVPLMGVDIYRHRGKIHGFSHVINIQTKDRLYHLCASQAFIYNDWLSKIREHYVPYSIAPEMDTLCRCPSDSSTASPGSLSDSIRSFSISSNCSTSSGASVASSSAFSDGDDMLDTTCLHVRARNYTTSNTEVSSTIRRNQTLPRDIHQNNKPTYSATKSYSAVESEDEGFGRICSDSSLTSLERLASLMNIDIKNFDRTSTSLGFVGPRIYARSNTMAPSSTLQRTQSVEDFLHPVNENATPTDI